MTNTTTSTRNQLKATVAEIVEFEQQFDNDLDKDTANELYAKVQELTIKLESNVMDACGAKVRKITIERICSELPNRQCYTNAYSVLG